MLERTRPFPRCCPVARARSPRRPVDLMRSTNGFLVMTLGGCCRCPLSKHQAPVGAKVLFALQAPNTKYQAPVGAKALFALQAPGTTPPEVPSPRGVAHTAQPGGTGGVHLLTATPVLVQALRHTPSPRCPLARAHRGATPLKRGFSRGRRCCDVPARWQGRDQDPSFLGAGSSWSIS
jgi:hypothetical protein